MILFITIKKQMFANIVVLVVAIIIIYNIYYAIYIHINFPKGTWVRSMDTGYKPVYDGEMLCAYLYKEERPYKKRKSNWSCISAKIDTILHNIDGDFVYDCKQKPELCFITREKEMQKFYIMDDLDD